MNAKHILNRLRQERKETNLQVAPPPPLPPISTSAAATKTIPAPAPPIIIEVNSNLQEILSHDTSDLEERTVFLESINTSIRLLEDPHAKWSSGNGATLWDAALVLTSYLLQEVCGHHGEREEHEEEDKTEQEQHHHQQQQLTFIEVGAGLGLPGLALSSQGHTVISTERPLTMRLLKANIHLNTLSDSSHSLLSPSGETIAIENERHPMRAGSIQAFPLEWTASAILEGGQGVEGGESGIESTSISLRERLRQTLDSTSRPEPGSKLRGITGSCCAWDVVLGSDLIFPNNQECWPALADVWDQLLSPLHNSDTHRPIREEEDESSGVITCTSEEGSIQQMDTDNKKGNRERGQPQPQDGVGVACEPRGYISYEHRSSHVIEKFMELLAARDISCDRCFSDHVCIPNDIHIYKLCKLNKPPLLNSMTESSACIA